jgi:hypothetical protein
MPGRAIDATGRYWARLRRRAVMRKRTDIVVAQYHHSRLLPRNRATTAGRYGARAPRRLPRTRALHPQPFAPNRRCIRGTQRGTINLCACKYLILAAPRRTPSPPECRFPASPRRPRISRTLWRSQIFALGTSLAVLRQSDMECGLDQRLRQATPRAPAAKTLAQSSRRHLRLAAPRGRRAPRRTHR